MSDSLMLIEGNPAPSDSEWDDGRNIDMMIAEFRDGMSDEVEAAGPGLLPVPVREPERALVHEEEQKNSHQERNEHRRQQGQEQQQQQQQSQEQSGAGAVPVSAPPGVDSLYNENVSLDSCIS